MYIHELKKWPEFSWDQDKLSPLLSSLHCERGRLLGVMGSMGFPMQDEAVLEALTQDVIKSSQIEGEMLEHSLVRSSVASHLGMEAAALQRKDRNVEGVVEMVLDATQRFEEPLTKKRLLSWHASLFPSVRRDYSELKVGAFRTGFVDVVSGQMGREKVHFEAPKADRVEKEMEQFLDWFNRESDMDLIVKAAVAHLWFITIHPFEDGNGRIGRAIADMLLARAEKSSRRFYSLSRQIQIERKTYYATLERTQKGSLEITEWIEWFISILQKAVEEALVTVDKVIVKARFWNEKKELTLNPRQKKVLNRLLDGFEGKLTTSKWAKIAKCSQDTAYRDILLLIDLGVLEKSKEGGRSTSYALCYTTTSTSS